MSRDQWYIHSNRGLKFWGRRRRRKGRSKSDTAFLQPSSRSLELTYFLCKRTLLELNSLETYPSSEGKRNPRRGLFTSSIKGEMRHFNVVFVQWRQSNLHWKKVWCTCKVVILLIKPIDRFHSRGQQLCKLLGIKESFNMWKEFNSHRIFFFAHKQGRRSIVLYTNMASVTSCENDLLLLLTFSLPSPWWNLKVDP